MALKFNTIWTQFYEFFTNCSAACCMPPNTLASLYIIINIRLGPRIACVRSRWAQSGKLCINRQFKQYFEQDARTPTCNHSILNEYIIPTCALGHYEQIQSNIEGHYENCQLVSYK